METLNFFLSAGPILVLIWLMTKKNGLPSYKALPLIGLVVLLIQLFYWGNGKVEIAASVFGASISTFTPVTIIFGAILFNRFIEVSGSIRIIKNWLSHVSPNPVAQLMIIGWAFAFMIEGASGFGTPAAIAAPLLVSLGFKPFQACVLTLIMNSVPVSFGAVGTPTWYGFGPLAGAGVNFVDVGLKSALVHAVAAAVVPVIALVFCVGWKDIKKNILFVYISIFSCVLPYLVIAQFNDEFPSLVGGALGLALSVFFAKNNIGLSAKTKTLDEVAEEHHEKLEHDPELDKSFTGRQVFFSFLPFMLLIATLIVTRLKQLPFKAMLTDSTPLFDPVHAGIFDFGISKSFIFSFTHIFGTAISESYKLLYVPALIPFVVTVLGCGFFYKVPFDKMGLIFKQSFKAVLLTYVALFGAFVMVKLMMLSTNGTTSMVTTIGDVFANTFGTSWIYFASYLGAIGAFFSGSNTVSNLTFGSIQNEIATKISVSQSSVLALQSVGGAMGNMVCLNNIIAVCTVTGVVGQEGTILKKTAVPMFVYGIMAAIAIFIYTTFFPGFWL